MGWKMRIAEANGYLRSGALSDIDPRVRPRLHDDLPGLAALASMVRCDPAGLGCLGSVALPGNDNLSPGPLIIGTYLLDRGAPKVCGACLAEAKFTRWEWDLKLWVGCPVHSETMISHCPGCGRPLSWNRPRLDRCCQGSPLDAAHGAALPPHVVELLRVVALKAGVRAPHPGAALNALLAQADLPQLLMLIKHLGLFSAWRGDVPRFASVKTLGLDANTTVFGLAADILCGWPGRFRETVDLAAAKFGTGDGGFGAAINRLSDSLRLHCRSDGTAFVLRELAAHTHDQHGMFSLALTVPGLREDAPVTLREASARLNIGQMLLRDWLRSGHAAGERLQVGGTTRWFLTRLEIARLASLLGPSPDRASYLAARDALSQKEAGQSLGLHQRTIRDFIRAGILEELAPGRSHPAVQKVNCISRRSVFGLLDRFEAIAARRRVPMLAAGQTRPKEWGDLGWLRLSMRGSLAEAVEVACRLSLAPVALDPSGKGVRRFLFSTDDLVKAAASATKIAPVFTATGPAKLFPAKPRP